LGVMSRYPALKHLPSFTTFPAVMLVTAALLLVPPAAQAQNTNYTPGDLVLFFQNPGGATGNDQQLFASLGNTATVFRDATPGAVVPLLNISAKLTSAFGANWASATTLYGGLGGVWGTSSLGTQLQNRDPQRTIYTSQQRPSVGIVGAPNSTGYIVSADGTMTSIANSVTAQDNILEVNGNAATAIVEVPTQGTSIANQNPAGGNGWNNNIPAPGVQQQGQAGTLGTFGTIANAEFLWDVYRIQAKNNIAGQYGFGDGVRQGEYLGTIALNSAGDLNFVAAGGTSPASAFDSWAESYSLDPAVTTGPTAGAPTADPDVDGFSNEQEFAFGTSPIEGTGTLLSVSIVNGNLVINAQQRNPGDGEPAYVLETCDDLSSGRWLESSIIPVSGNIIGDYTQMTYTIPGVSGRGFYRLTANQ